MAAPSRGSRLQRRAGATLGSGQDSIGSVTKGDLEGGVDGGPEAGGTGRSRSWRDVVTLPNAVSTLGLVLTLRGAAHLDSRRGLTQAAAGRVLDVVDGALARHLHQTSSSGAALDAGSDKVALAALVAATWRHGLVPRPVLVAIVTQNLLNAVATAGAEVRTGYRGLAPAGDGKLAMACQHAAMAAYALAAVSGPGPWRAPVARALRVLGHTATAVGVGHFGVRASAAYLRRTGTDPHPAGGARTRSGRRRARETQRRQLRWHRPG